MTKSIPQPTIQALSRSVFKEATQYGFGQIDIIRLINELMDLCREDPNSLREYEPNIGRSLQGVVAEFEDLPLQGPNVVVRAYEEDDRPLLESWLPDKYGRYFVLSCSTAQEITIDSLTASENNHLGVVCDLAGRPIGAMTYIDHSQRQQRAELRKLIGDPEFRGKGFAEEATRLWIGYGIAGLGLRKIYVSTLQTQIANIRLNERIGFIVEGLLNNEVLIDGERHDVLRMGLSASDFDF
jgi:RimJ/RimL family protein N-acetyltransferase